MKQFNKMWLISCMKNSFCGPPEERGKDWAENEKIHKDKPSGPGNADTHLYDNHCTLSDYSAPVFQCTGSFF